MKTSYSRPIDAPNLLKLLADIDEADPKATPRPWIHDVAGCVGYRQPAPSTGQYTVLAVASGYLRTQPADADAGLATFYRNRTPGLALAAKIGYNALVFVLRNLDPGSLVAVEAAVALANMDEAVRPKGPHDGPPVRHDTDLFL